MTMKVTSYAAPSATAKKGRKRRGKNAQPLTVPSRRLPALATPAASAAQAASTASQAGAALASKPIEIVKSPEYSEHDYRDSVGEILGGSATEFISPYIGKAVSDGLDPKRFPFLASPYGAVIPGKIAGTIAGQVNSAVSSIVADTLKGGKGAPGLGWKPTPVNKLLAGTVKGVATTWMRMAITDALKPAPQPVPIYAPSVKPVGVKMPPTPPTPKKVLLTDTAQIKSALTNGIIGMGISALYDQVVGPLVQRAANFLTGRSGEEVKAPAAITPGRVVNGLVDSVLSSMLVRSVSYQPLPPAPGSPPPQPGPTPMAGALGISLINGVLGAAWSTVYGRGLGTSIENSVNDLAGIRSKEDKAKDTLPALEHFLRAATRGVAVGGTTYMLGNALNASMVKLGASMGGVGGAIVAVAGAALLGSIGGTIVDATIGPMLGKLGGQIYSWITGRPAYEERMKDAKTGPEPGPTPGDVVDAPNGNPGTVPAPDTPKAPAAPIPAPAQGRPKKRKKTGNRAVDATSPAINISNARLAAIALKG